ncbi:MAG: glycosyltransferase [Propionibacteriaceae bacterium]
MKVLQVNSVCGRGSTGRIAVGIAKRLEEQGNQCTIAYGRDTALGWEDTIYIGNRSSIIDHHLATRLLDAHGLRSTKATHNFISSIDWDQFDLIHLHNVHGYYLNIEVLFSHLRTLTVPIVWTLHDTWSLTGHCAWFEQSGCTAWITGCTKCPQLSEYPSSWFFDGSARNWHRKKAAFSDIPFLTLVTPSNWLKNKVAISHLGSYPIAVIPNEVDSSVFIPTPSNLRQKYGLINKYVILAVANAWSEAKGLHHLLELSHLLRESEALVVVGLTEKQVAALPTGIIGITRTASITELAQWYSAANIFINPTLEDISSMTNLEAASVGLPVVTFRTGGAPETIEGMTGVILGDRSAAGLRRGIDEMYDQDFPNKGVIQNRIGDKKAYTAYVDLYAELLSQGSTFHD